MTVRNFMLAVAEIYLGYYKEASPLATELSHAVEELFEVSADVDSSEEWSGYSFYLDEMEKNGVCLQARLLSDDRFFFVSAGGAGFV